MTHQRKIVFFGFLVFLVLLVLLVFFSKDLLFPVWAAPKGEMATIPFRFQKNECNPIIEIEVSGKNISVVLDTGTTTTALAYDVIAPTTNTWPLVSGLRVATPARIGIGNLEFLNPRIAVFKPKSHPMMWPKEVKGLMGTEVFNHFVVIFDLEKQVIEFIKPEKFIPLKGTERIPLKFVSSTFLASRKDHPYIGANVEGNSATFLFDTGNTSDDIILTPKFVRSFPTIENGSYSHSKGGPWKIRDHIQVQIGSNSFDMQAALYEDKHGPFDPEQGGNIGCGIFQKGMKSVTVDFHGEAIYFEK